MSFADASTSTFLMVKTNLCLIQSLGHHVTRLSSPQTQNNLDSQREISDEFDWGRGQALRDTYLALAALEISKLT